MRRALLIAGALLLAAPGSAAAAPARADLQVSAVKLTGTQLEGTVRNAGSGKAGKSTLDITASKTRLARVTIKALAPRKTATFKVTLKAPATLAAGRHVISACADAAKKVKESKETNNCRTAATRLTISRPAPAPAPPFPAPLTPVTPGATPAPTTVPTATPTSTPVAPVGPTILTGPLDRVGEQPLTFTFAGTGPFECRLDAAPFTVCTSPVTFPVQTPGAHAFELRNAAGTIRRAFTVIDEAPAPGPVLTAPPNPAQQAPAPKLGETTLIGDSTAFLYTGPNAAQKDVAPNTISQQRAAVLRGRVVNRMNAAVVGARVRVLDHPEYGYTATRADGGFDLAVNGGGPLVIVLERAGYVPVQRTLEPAVQDFEAVPEITMIPYDDEVTRVNLGAPVVARGSEVTDADGKRQATLMFEPGTKATAEQADGTVVALPDTIKVRATEFTVGDSGPAAMPGELPPTSAYTYAVEYSVDEADELGAVDVRFDKPVATYTDNFLGFPVGTAVPSGYYAREQARWIASRNGVVIKIVSEAGGLANVDTNGDGVADNAGINAAERRNLATLYDAGKELWRVEVDHFTPWDYNWPYGPPDGSGPPGMGGPNGGDGDGGCDTGGSIIGCENQTLGEEAAIAGTDLTLRYASDRVPGRRSEMSLDVPLTPENPPASMSRVELQVQVAGQTITKSYAPGANLKDVFTWDGKDAYGRTISGRQKARVKLSYVYPVVYRTPAAFESAFAAFGGARLQASTDRSEVAASQEWDISVGGLQAPPSSIGGWNLDLHQTYDPVGRTLYGGDGSKRSAEGQNFDVLGTDVGPPRTGARVSVELDAPEGFVRAPDGTVYIADTGHNVIRRISPGGTATVLAGTGEADFADGPAAEAAFDEPADLALGMDGALYVADRGNQRVRKVAGGVVRTVAGTGESGWNAGPVRAADAVFEGPSDVAVTTDGTLYVIDAGNHALRRITPDGVIATVLGTGAPGQLRNPRDVAVRGDGAVLVADTGNHRVRMLAPDGTVSTVAGVSGMAGHRGDGEDAKAALLRLPSAVAPKADGGLLIADAGNNVIRSVASDGIITTVAGNVGSDGSSGDGGAAPRGQVGSPEALAPNGRQGFLALDTSHGRLRSVEPAMPALGVGEFFIPSTTGQQLYVFSQTGRHLKTLDAMTSAPLYTFGYDAAGRLIAVTDDSGNKTDIVRDGAGRPTSITGPYGHTTTLKTDADGYLSEIAPPAGGALRLRYGSGGLLTGLTDPREGTHTYTYDAAGRLLTDRNGRGSVQRLDRSTNGTAVTVKHTTAGQRVTTYRNERLPNRDVKRTVTDAAGAVTTTVVGEDGVTTVTRPTGEIETFRLGPDPRFGMAAPVITSTTIRIGGIVRNAETSRAVELNRADDPLSIKRMVETRTINGRASQVVYDAATKIISARSTLGAVSETEIDAARRPVRFRLPGMTEVEYRYDARGRLERRAQGPRLWRYTYNDQGLQSRVVNPENEATTYQYDASGRMLSRTLPGTRTVMLDYDAAGDVAGVTPPERGRHGLTYTTQGLIATYTAAGGSAMTLDYDADDLLTTVDRPGAGDAQLAYDSAGRVQALTLSGRGETVEYDYADVTGRRSVVRAPGQTVATAYNGPLPVKETFTGDAVGVLERYYDDDLRVETTEIGGAYVGYEYDDNGLRIGAGALTTERAANGLIAQTTLDNVTSVHDHDSFGEPTQVAYSGPAGFAWREEVRRDNAGRIEADVVNGVTTAYVRDGSGRLQSAQRIGGSDTNYTYDKNGNLLTREVTGGAKVTGVVGADDRLLSWGATSFTYQDSGERRTKVAGGVTTTYDYDARGALRSVAAPGLTLAYTVDGLGRRTAVRKNGTVTARFIYGEAAGPSAEVDSSGNVLARYVYGSRSNVPDYMERGGQRFRFILDQRGSVRAVVNANTGVVVQRIDYDAFGRRTLVSEQAGFSQPFGFAGGLYDADTGLVNFQARDYDPEIGRFTAKDPIGFDGGDANVYAYAGNDPVSFVDPSGEIVPLAVAAAVIGGGLVNGAIEGVKAAIAGCSLGTALGAAGRGFVAGSVGTAAGFAVGAAFGPIAGGIAGGAVSEGISQGMSGDFDAVGMAVGMATGPLGVGGKIVKVPGFQPNLWRPRGPGTSLTYGPNSRRIIGQTAVDSAWGNALGTGAMWGWNAMRGCPTSNC